MERFSADWWQREFNTVADLLSEARVELDLQRPIVEAAVALAEVYAEIPIPRQHRALWNRLFKLLADRAVASHVR